MAKKIIPKMILMKNQKIRYISLAIALVIAVVLVSFFLIFNSRNNNKKKTTDNDEIEEITDEYKKDELAKLVKIIFENVNDSNIKSYLKKIKKMDEIKIKDVVDLVLPDCFDVLPNLTDLIIISSSLESLPKSFGKMKNLKKLYLSGNKLDESSLKQIFEIKSLEILDVSYNELTTIPSDIENLSKLTRLDLSNNKLNDSSLKQIFEISSLEVLDIYSNELTAIHSEIKNLKKLKELNLGKNKLNDSSLKQIFEIRSLEVLNIFSNELTAIPSEIKNLKKLKELHLNSNKLDADKAESSLEHICKIGGSLEILYLSNMNITILPANLSNLEKLKELYLSYNRNLQADNEEFKGIYKLKNLERLEIRGCESLDSCKKEIRTKIRNTFGIDFVLTE